MAISANVVTSISFGFNTGRSEQLHVGVVPVCATYSAESLPRSLIRCFLAFELHSSQSAKQHTYLAHGDIVLCHRTDQTFTRHLEWGVVTLCPYILFLLIWQICLLSFLFLICLIKISLFCASCFSDESTHCWHRRHSCTYCTPSPLLITDD